MATMEYHVERADDGSWRVRRGDRDLPVATYANRTAAVSAARVLAHLNTGGVVVHDIGGDMQLTDHRGRSPAPAVNQRIRMRS